MIASFFDGRVRIRAEELKDPAVMQLAKTAIQAQKGILSLEGNPRTGSLLILYDPGKVSRESLAAAAQMLDARLGRAAKTEKSGKACSWRARLSARQESALMTLLYGVTALTGFGNRRLHVAAGVGFAALAAWHVYTRRRLL